MGLYDICKNCCTCQCCQKQKKTLNRRDTIAVHIAASHPASDNEIIDQVDTTMNIEEIEEHYMDVKNIYAYAVEAMKNFLGKPFYPFISQPKQLYPYILFLCEDLQEQEFLSMKDRIEEKELVNIQLTVIVKEANLIHPKVTEFSRIFCKLWINSKSEKFTSVKESSSYLLWDEAFILDVINYESDVFHIEIWSSRPGLLEKIAAFSLESFKEDDPLAEEEGGMYFLGDAVEYVKCLPCIGQNMVWTLKRGPRRIQTKGQINVYLQLSTKKDSEFILHLHCHMALMRLCYKKQVMIMEESSALWKNWLEILPNTALTLIQQHALQHGITPVEQCLCSWLVISSLKMRQEDRISFYLLRDLLGYLLAGITEETIGQMKEVLCISISEFSQYTLEMLNDLHKNFDVLNIKMADELYYMLKCMSTAELKLIINYVESYKMIEDEASVWYLQVIGDLKKELEADESIEKMGEGLKDITKIYLRNQILLDDIFNRAWHVSYSSITYRKLDEVVYIAIQPMIKHLMVLLESTERKSRSVDSLKMLQLYHNVRNLVNYVTKCIPTKRTVLRMDEYSTWFGEGMILEWFLLCDIYTHPFIQRAVLADPMERLDKKIDHGTSVPDVTSIIDEMVIEVWMKLKWKEKFYTHGALVEAMKSCVLDYGKNILNRIKLENFYCQMQDFEVTAKLCVALSNIYAMSEHLGKTKKKIRRELKTAESYLGFTIADPLTVVQCEMQIMTTNIFLLVFQKINTRVKQLLRETVNAKIEFLSSGVGDLCLFIDNSLEIMYCNLKSEAFHVVLRQMWIIVLKRLQKGLKYSKGCFITRKRSMHICMIMLQTLNQMRGIFFCDGHGLSHYEMENKIFEGLKLELEAKLQVK